MAKAKKNTVLSLEEKLEQALVPVEEWPYEVPGNWCWVKLGNLINVFSGKGLTAKNMNHVGKIPVYGGNGITGYHDEGFIGEDNIVIGRVGAYCGCVHYIAEWAWVTDNALIVDYNREYIDSKYLYWLLKSLNLRENDSSSAQPVISGSKIYSLYCTIAPLVEQQRIVEQIESLFAKLDEAKEQIQSVLASSEERKSAILFKAYSGALTKEWRKQNGKTKDEWQKVCLKEVCKINPPKINAKDYDDNMEVSFFPMPALSEITGSITEPQIRKLGEVKTGFTNFSEGDVVFAKITPCMENGKSAIIGKLVNDIGYGTTEFYVMRCSKKLLNGYLYHLVRNKYFRDEAKAVMTGAVGQQRVPKTFLEEYKLNLPSAEEQGEILRLVDVMIKKEMNVVVNCKKVIEQIDLMKKSILAKAFRGELGTNNPEEESAIELLKQILSEV